LRHEPDRRLRYGGPWVVAASALPLDAHAIRPRPVARLVAAAVRRPRRLVALIALLLRTPTEYVALSATPAGQALDEYFGGRAWWVLPRQRFCRGLLRLPLDHADYLRGRRRQAVRTNLRRAAAAGIRCEVVADGRGATDEIAHVLEHWRPTWAEEDFHALVVRICAMAQRPETTVMVARDAHGRPLAMAAAVIDDTVCLIRAAVARSHEARWALHDHLVRLLIARRVEYLLADGGGPFGALGAGPNVRHYQHLLGYELRHVVPMGARRGRRRRRMFASLAAMAATVAVVAPSSASCAVTPTGAGMAPARFTSAISAYP
jgi:hypothetical protein